jgi:uncharacterized protein
LQIECAVVVRLRRNIAIRTLVDNDFDVQGHRDRFKSRLGYGSAQHFTHEALRGSQSQCTGCIKRSIALYFVGAFFMTRDPSKENRGFASMDEKKQRSIAAEGGRAAHASGRAHEFDSEEARQAGRKGGEAVSRDREHMSEIGKEGGRRSSGGSHEQHVKAGQQSHKNI